MSKRIDQCTSLVVSLVQQRGLKLPESHLREVIKEYDKLIADKKFFSLSEQQELLDAAVENVKQRKIVLRQMKLEAMMRLVSANRLNDFVQRYEGSEIDGLLAFMRGESKMELGSRNSLANKEQGTFNLLYSNLEQLLKAEKPEVRAALASGDLDAEIYLLAYDKDADVSDLARAAFKALRKQSDSVRERLNRAGAFIGDREDYLGFKQSHDMRLIRKAGYDQWRADIIRLVDPKKTFKDMNEAQKEDYLQDLFNRFISGKHYLADNGETLAGVRPSSSNNIARRISQARKIHFADGASAFEYAKKYTEGNIWDKSIVKIKTDSRTITSMENLGPNPGVVIETVLRNIEQRAQARQETVPSYKIKSVRDQFDYMNGLHDIPSNDSLAYFGFVFRALESMSKLGGAVLSAGPDLVFKAATLNRRTDMGVFKSYVTAMTDFVGSVPKSDQKFAAEMGGLYAEVVSGTIFARVGDTDGMPGKMARAQEKFFKWNFLQHWTMAHKRGLVAALQLDLGRYRLTKFDELPPNTKRNLELYDITKDEWEVLQFGETQNPETGNHFITAQAVRTLPDEKVDSLLAEIEGTTDITPDMRATFKDRLSAKIQAMAVDVADEGVVTPGQRERTLLTLGTQKGTVLGEFMRFATQFKAFPVTVITKQLLPQYYAAGGGVRGMMSLVPIMLATTALGYVSGAAKDLAKGREPKDPRDPKVFVDAMVRGGGLGLFGDFMFQEYSRYGRSLEQTLLGPGIGTMSDFASLAHKTATGKADAGDFFTFTKNITPGQNLFYTESAFNYLFYYGLMEMNEPGYLRRMERKRMKEYDQDYWLSPSQDSVSLFD